MSLDRDVGLRVTGIHFAAVLIKVARHRCAANPTVDVLTTNDFFVNRLRVDSSKRSDDFYFFVSNALGF